MKKRRNLMIGFIAVAVILSGSIMISKTASAEEIVVPAQNDIIYVKDETKYDIKKYWSESEKKAPVRKGYVFAGWYEDTNESETSVLTEEEAKTATEAWAKFVPDYVLSVKAQNEEGTALGDKKNNSTRVLSSVDSDKYLNVGFDIWLANKKQLVDADTKTAPLITDRAYTNIMVGEKTVSATDTFGAASKYFVVWRLDNIADVNDGKIIYVRPYWVTMDGTTVYGLAKYVHIEDEYLDYISVPVNLMTGEAIAAGVVEMEYSGLTFVGFETGRLLKEMAANYATDGIVRMAGNAENEEQEVFADGIYANLRFVKPGNTDPNTLIEMPEDADFANWEEREFAITPIIQY